MRSEMTGRYNKTVCDESDFVKTLRAHVCVLVSEPRVCYLCRCTTNVFLNPTVSVVVPEIGTVSRSARHQSEWVGTLSVLVTGYARGGLTSEGGLLNKQCHANSLAKKAFHNRTARDLPCHRSQNMRLL